MTPFSHQVIIFSPFAHNVLDYINHPALTTPSGKPVKIYRSGMKFAIQIGEMPVFYTDDNLAASAYLNRFEVGVMNQ